MPWGPVAQQLYSSNSDPVQVLDHLESALTELGIEDEGMTSEPPIQIVGAIRHWQGKNRMARFSQKIRFVLEIARGVGDEGTVLSVVAQGGDVQGTSSKRGVTLITEALESRGVDLVSLPFEGTATDFVQRMNFGIEIETVKRLAQEHGSEWVKVNAPPVIYEAWRSVMIREGIDPDSFPGVDQ